MSEQLIYEGGVICCGATWDRCQHTTWRITSNYIEYSKGVCCTTVQNLQMIRVKDIQYKGGCCDGCSEITVLSTDTTDPVIKLRGIPNSRHVFDQLRDVISKINSGARLEIETH